VACVDPSEDALREARTCHGQDHGIFSPTLHDALARVSADAVLVSTPTFAHAQHVTEALDAGLPVLVEKPFAASLADAAAVVERSRATGRPVMVAENYRFYKAERTLCHLLETGVAGKLHWATCVDRRHQPSETQGPWVRAMDHPFLVEIAVHHFDSFRYLFQRQPLAVSALSYNLPRGGYEREVGATAIIEMDGGLPIQYGGTMAGARFEFALWVEGERGDLWTDRQRVWWRARGARFFRPCRSVAVARGDDLPYPNAGTVSLLNQFRDLVQQDRTPETSGADNLWTLAMVEASVRSHNEKRRVMIDEVLTPVLKRQAGLSTP
jgi:predicted dehydrogenase